MRRLRAIALTLTLGVLAAGCIDDATYYAILCALIGGVPYLDGGCYSASGPVFIADSTPAPSAAVALGTAPVELYFPQIATGGGYVTTITLMHTDSRTPLVPAVGKITFYNPDGTARSVDTLEMGSGSEFDVTIPAGGVRILTANSVGDVKIGGAKFVATGASIAGVATFTFGSAVVGVLGGTPIQLGYIPLNTRSGFSNGVAVQNPGATPINLQFSVLNPDGTVEQTSFPRETNPLPPNGQFSRFAGPEMGFTKAIRPDSTLQIQVAGSGGNFVALPLVLGNNLFSSSAIVASDIETPVVFPQVADGGGYVTVMRLFNPRAATITATLRFFRPDGTSRPVALLNRGTNSEFQLTIGARSTVVVETTGSASTVGVGMARIDSTVPIGAVATIFTPQQGHLGVLASARMRSARIPVNTRTGYNTGVALAAGFDRANFKMTLQNRDGAGGQTVQPAEITPIPSQGQFARYVTEMGFGGAAGLGDSSLLIEPVTTGAFAPLALLDRAGVFSTTAAARQTLFSPADLAGNYVGTWTNPSYNGPMTMSFTVNSSNNTATGVLNVPDEFPPLGFTGAFGSDGFLGATPGQGTLAIRPDGTISLNTNLTNPSLVTALTLVGEFNGTTASGTFEVTWTTSPAVPPLKGTWSLTKR